MRALLLLALLAPTAAAQSVLSLPEGTAAPRLFGADRCDARPTMPTPFAVDPGAAAVEVEMGGPAAVPMPNLCAAPLAAFPAGPISLEGFLDRYRELLPEESNPFDSLGDFSGGPDALVAPPGDRE